MLKLPDIFTKTENKKYLLIFLALNLFLVVFQLLYLVFRFSYINTEIPFFYTNIWGDSQLAQKNRLFLLPMLTALLIPAGVFFFYLAKKYFILFADKIVLGAITVTNTLLTLSLVRIVHIASSPFSPLIKPELVPLGIPFGVVFALTFLLTPKFINYYKSIGIVTNPKVHSHPGMTLETPSARGAGLIFAIALIGVSIMFVGVSKLLVGIYLATFLIAVLGLIDDYQNTHPKSKFAFLENPFIRLGLVSLIVLLPVIFGVRINTINNPFNGLIDFSAVTVQIGTLTIPWLSIVITVLWIVWVQTVLSWSNGVDGQYGGIVGIACIVIAILALRFVPLTTVDLQMARIAVVASGAAWGLMRYTWFPSKIMWGFGAYAAGLIIAVTSVMIEAKVAVATIIILIPFLDAIVTIIRRAIKGKNPLKADKGHLHHFLHKKGWGVRRIAVFYWLATAVFGFIGIVSADKDLLLLVLTFGGLVAFAILGLIVSLQLQDKLKQQQLE